MYKNHSITVENVNETDNIKFLRKLQENVAKLDKLQQYEIFKIIKTYNNKLTENKNGIFINLSSLDQECIQKINDFITYSLDNRKRLDNMEVLSQTILKNSILNHEYKNYDIKDTRIDNNKSDLLNLKSRNDKNKDKKIKDVSNNNKMSENDLVMNLELGDETLEREYNLYQQNIENEDLSLKGMINNLNQNSELPENQDVMGSETREEYTHNKKNKFTGKRGRIFKKCKENSKNINLNSLVSYNNYTENIGLDNEDDEEYSGKINELTEDIFE